MMTVEEYKESIVRIVNDINDFESLKCIYTCANRYLKHLEQMKQEGKEPRNGLERLL